MATRILVVDDEVDELTGWETVLRKAGYTVQTASTGARALELSVATMFDLVILDFVMPKMKGLELLARIRKQNPLVRSILISGKLDQKIPERDVNESIRGEVETDRYLHKPVKNEQLLEAVAEVLKGRRSNKAWDSIAADYLEGEKGTISKARGAQGKLKKYVKKK